MTRLGPGAAALTIGVDRTTGTRAMGRWLAALFASGSTLALISLVLPHWPETDTVPTAITAASGYPAAALLYFLGHRLRPWMFHALLVAGTAIVTLGVYFGHGGGGSPTSAIFYVWVALYAFNFFSWTAALGHMLVVALSYAVVLSIEHAEGAPAQWLLVVGTTVTSGVVIGALVEEIRELARCDPLTGLANRRAWEEQLERELARAARQRIPLCVALVDLDDFKAHNDRLGHQGGDGLLVGLADAWQGRLRGEDFLARFGGDEFALVLPRSAPENATAVLDRLREGTGEQLGFSAGAAAWDGSESAVQLMGRADAALYAAKRSGRGQVSVAGHPSSGISSHH